MTVKNIMGPDWMVACMIPKGNMMMSMLKKVDSGFKLVQFNCTKKETKDNQELEAEFKAFFEKGISNITKEGICEYDFRKYLYFLILKERL